MLGTLFSCKYAVFVIGCPFCDYAEAIDMSSLHEAVMVMHIIGYMGCFFRPSAPICGNVLVQSQTLNDGTGVQTSVHSVPILRNSGDKHTKGTPKVMPLGIKE